MQRRKNQQKRVRLLLTLFAALSLSGCSYCYGLVFGQPTPQPESIATPAAAVNQNRQPADVGTSTARTGAAAENINIRLQPAVMFELDSAFIRPQFQTRLQDYARQLQATPSISITVEGHCCELGSGAYNVALGERRARAVKQYLVDLGVNPMRISMVSYGEERPVDRGHNEPARAKNRRAEFISQ